MFTPEGQGFDLALMLEAIAHQLSGIASRPLTAKELLAALPITNQERLRWTKDGRLVQQGSALLRRGQAISIPTYAVGPVQALMTAPENLECWRAQDRRFEDC